MQFFPGDVIEIETPSGLAYVQVTHNHVVYPEVVRVLRGLYGTPPGDLRILAELPTRFAAMFPLASAIQRGWVTGRKVAEAKVPAADQRFPTFKMPIHDREGNLAYWWFWEGEGLRYSTDIEQTHDDCPMREVPTVATFLARLEGRPEPSGHGVQAAEACPVPERELAAPCS
ncbi:hypothetical protein [Rhizobium sp. P007]|jgi:hypothetical protein|uniref:hypothetical protein n=1 Tax=Rhizobium sp. P007 TaxID=285908 RepID=UPI00115C2D62|nr:hypothetical protein [Rhizobium sp. P007]CAD7045551.1 hypothetical protein RP007_04895 [Rhizobium sp. P007]